MRITKELAIPELDEEVQESLIDLLSSREKSDQGICIKLRTGQFARGAEHEFHAPTVLSAAFGRKLHGDRGLHAYPLFSDRGIIETVEMLGLVSPKSLTRGVFCLDLKNRIVGYNPDLSGRARDQYRTTYDPRAVFSFNLTAMDVLEECIRVGFDLRRFESDKFTEELSKDGIVMAQASAVELR